MDTLIFLLGSLNPLLDRRQWDVGHGFRVRRPSRGILVIETEIRSKQCLALLALLLGGRRILFSGCGGRRIRIHRRRRRIRIWTPPDPDIHGNRHICRRITMESGQEMR